MLKSDEDEGMGVVGRDRNGMGMDKEEAKVWVGWDGMDWMRQGGKGESGKDWQREADSAAVEGMILCMLEKDGG